MSPLKGSYGLGKYWLIYIKSLLNELSYPFHLTYNLSPFFLINFSILNSCWPIFCNSSLFRSLVTYVHGTVFLISLMTKTSSGQFGVYPSAKMSFYFDILT